MIQKIKTFTNLGLEGFEINVEVDSNRSLPGIEIIGLPDAAIKESKERIRATFRNSNIELPKRKLILNLAPSDIKKIGTSFDLPMAVAILILIQDGKLHNSELINNSLFFGELGLDGDIKRVNGLLPCIISAIKKGYKNFFVPYDNIYELEYIPNINIFPIKNFIQIIDLFSNGKEFKEQITTKNIENIYSIKSGFEVDFKYIKGHIFAKRAISIATAGLHNILMIGSPGSGKTLLSKAIQSILPPLSFDEILELSKIYSVIGKLNKDVPLITQRPFREVHHTASKISITGGGSNLKPGEVSLAHKGILFFDELTEFPREVLEVLRQPIENGIINISRVSGTIQYPANFMLVSSMNPCKCGFYKDKSKHCVCSINEIKKYQNKISGPLLDRIDMILEIPRESSSKILEKIEAESSESIGKKVEKARIIQQNRFKGQDIKSNSEIGIKNIDKFIKLDSQTKDFLSQASNNLILSPRVIHRIMKLARTISDMEEKQNIEIKHIAEAIQYRSKTMFIEEI